MYRFVLGNNGLRDTVAMLNNKRYGAMVDEYHFYFPAVIAVDRTGSVEYGYSVLRCKAAARTHLHFMTFR